jgi:hypothetical protein
MYRQMQFNPTRYPIVDVNFKPASTLGLMAREYEQQQLAQVLQTVPPESPAYFLILAGFFENSSLQNSFDITQSIKQMAQQTSQPKPPDPAVMAQAQAQQQQNQIAAGRLHLDTQKAAAEAMMQHQELQFTAAELAQKQKELQLKEQELALKSSQIAAETSLKQLAQQQQHDRDSAKLITDAHIRGLDAKTYQEQTAIQALQKGDQQTTKVEKPEPVVVNVGGSKKITLVRKNGVLEGANIEQA